MNPVHLFGSLLLRGLGLGALGGAGFGFVFMASSVWPGVQRGDSSLGYAVLTSVVLGLMLGAVIGGALGLVSGVIAWAVVMAGVPQPAVGAAVAGVLALAVLLVGTGGVVDVYYASPVLLIAWAMTQWGVQRACRRASRDDATAGRSAR